MYKSNYEPIEDKPLTTTIPMLLNWKGVSPQKIDDDTGSKISQANIHRICAGKTKNPGEEVVGGIASFFGLTISQIYNIDYVKKFISRGGWVKHPRNRPKDISDAETVNAGTPRLTSVQEPVESYGNRQLEMEVKNLKISEKIALLKEIGETLPIKYAAQASVYFAEQVQRKIK